MRRFVGWWRARPERWMTLLLLALTLTKGIFWVSLYPIWKITDEPAHFDNIQFRAEHGLKTPLDTGRDMDKIISKGVSKEMDDSWDYAVKHFRTTYSSTSSTIPEEAKLEALAKDPAKRLNDGQMPSIGYPGVYYTLGTIPYFMFRENSIVTRIYAVRMLSLLFGVMAVLSTFFAARLAFEDPYLAFTAAAIVALQPMFSQQTAGVTNDAGVFGFCGLAFYLQCRMLARGRGRPHLVEGALLGATVALAILTKGQGWVMLATSVGLLAWLTVSCRWDSWRAWVPATISYALLMWAATLWPQAPMLNPTPSAVQAAANSATTAMPYNIGHVLDMAWGLVRFVERLDDDYRTYLVQSSFGKFAWLEYSLSGRWVENIFRAVPLVWVGLAVAAVIRAARPDLARWWRLPVVIFAAATALIAVCSILFVEFNFRENNGGSGLIQGRNFLFATPAYAIMIVLGLAAVVPRKLRGLSMAFLFTCALSLNVAAVLCILRRNYGID